ncbi:MAG TPA: hypothetical protein VGK80_01775 [Rhodanobacteraceae bacterium]
MPKNWFRCGLAALTVWCAFAIFNTASATTYYVRTDGGTPSQCTGLANAAYPGSGSGQSCAWHSPMDALPPAASNQPNKARIKGGDTLVINSGSYMIGYSSSAQSLYGENVCAIGYPYQCIPQPVPSGPDAAHPTVIKGASCTAPPVLWGTEGAGSVLSLDGSSNVSIQCLELTDHSACILYYAPSASGQCNRNWGKDVGTWADMGIHAQDSGNVSLQNLNIHGLADRGVMAGRIHDWNVSNVIVRANGWAGWDGDLGGNNHNSANSGALTFDHLTVEWNGCAEAYPSTTIINCWGQNEGGYGDGFAEAWTGGNFVFTNSQFLHNASDGLDLLYANGTGSIVLDRVYAAFSAGNQIKTSGTATLQNSVINGYCNDWQPPMPIAGDGSSGVAGTMCRADGTAVVMEFAGKGEKVLLQYNTITGNGDTLFVGGSETMTPDASDVTTFSNNIWLGQHSAIPRDDGNYTALDWYSDGTYYGVVNYQNNVVWNVKSNFCPSGSICKDPKLANETMAGLDATLLTGSPAIGAAKGGVVLAYDYDNNARKNPTSIGALEYGSSESSGGGSGDPPPIVPPRAPGRPICKWRFCNRIMTGAGERAYSDTGTYRAPAAYTAPAKPYTPRTPYSTVVDRNKY